MISTSLTINLLQAIAALLVEEGVEAYYIGPFGEDGHELDFVSINTLPHHVLAVTGGVVKISERDDDVKWLVDLADPNLIQKIKKIVLQEQNGPG
jgi:hypothetical protein